MITGILTTVTLAMEATLSVQTDTLGVAISQNITANLSHFLSRQEIKFACSSTPKTGHSSSKNKTQTRLTAWMWSPMEI